MIRPTETLRHRTARRRCGAFTATLLTAGMLAVTAAAGAAETRIYRTVDEDGNVVFTDVPPKSEQPGQSVDLNESNTFTAPERAGTGRSVESWLGGAEEDQEQEPADTGYRSLSITSPPPNAPLRDNAGNVTVTAALDPDLYPGHSVQLYLDGTLARSGRTTTFELTNVDRGTHQVELRVVDGAGNLLIASDTSTFHLQRRSVLLQPARRQGN